jgi:putative flippase GtrA
MALAGERDKKRDTLAYSFRGRVLKRNLIIALVVGIVLSVANQFDVLLTQPWTPRLGVKIFFNFLIPFVVSSASAWVNRQTP